MLSVRFVRMTWATRIKSTQIVVMGHEEAIQCGAKFETRLFSGSVSSQEQLGHWEMCAQFRSAGGSSVIAAASIYVQPLLASQIRPVSSSTAHT